MNFTVHFMKTIGLIGGMSWVSTRTYYQIINDEVNRRLGGLHSASALIHSVDFARIEPLQREGRWDEAGEILASAAVSLQRGGADCALICANTMHEVYERVSDAIEIPLLHIADALGAAIQAAGVRRVGLLGTNFTMEREFLRKRLADRFQVAPMIPGSDDRDVIHRIIFDELVAGIQSDSSRRELDRIVDSLVAEGAEGVILGCTEFSGVIESRDGEIPLFDTTQLHATAAVDWALA